MTSDGAERRLRAGDRLPSFDFADGTGSTWSTDAHRSIAGVPLVLILHRHLA